MAQTKKKDEDAKYFHTNLRMTEKDFKTVKKATLDFSMGYREIILLGVKTLREKSKCSPTSSKDLKV